MDRINQVTQNSKAIQVVDLIQKINDKVIIFTEYRATQIYLQWFLQQNGISSVPFRGGFKRGKRLDEGSLPRQSAGADRYRSRRRGINLQFCNHIINYDLPWNPMRLEQRIGRIHRLGQERDVHIYNMATKHTVEEHILKLLYDKIHLFENVVGELDDILTKIKVSNFEDHLHDILCHSLTEEEMRIKMDNLTSFLSYGTDKPARKKDLNLKGGSAT